MKVKVGNKIFDGTYDSIMNALSYKEKESIGKMGKTRKRYCVAGFGNSSKDITKWLKEI